MTKHELSVLRIDLWGVDGQGMATDCVVCGGYSSKSGIPVYEDFILPNEWHGEWGGAPACNRCRLLQGQLDEPINIRDFRELACEDKNK